MICSCYRSTKSGPYVVVFIVDLEKGIEEVFESIALSLSFLNSSPFVVVVFVVGTAAVLSSSCLAKVVIFPSLYLIKIINL
jgi:hypothetical protein